MKLVLQSLIVGLLLAETGAYKLLQQLRIRDNESDEIDADDPDINDASIDSSQDLQVYQHTFLNEGKNVNKLNKSAIRAAEIKRAEEENIDLDDNMNYSLPQNLADKGRTSQKSELYKAPDHPRPAHPVKAVYATSPAEVKQKVKELELDNADIQLNTQMWANSHAAEDTPPKVEVIEIGEIETKSMNLKQKSDLLHDVALSAQSDLKEQIITQRVSDEDRKKEIYRQAENLDLQIMDIEKMKFSAAELNNYEALT